jgi:hypothetical protein
MTYNKRASYQTLGNQLRGFFYERLRAKVKPIPNPPPISVLMSLFTADLDCQPEPF